MTSPDSNLTASRVSGEPVRIIARLDIKGSHLIKGVHLEGLRKLGQPIEFATRYYQQGIDEILFIDVVASLYGRGQLLEIVRETATGVFVPLTVGGGVRTIRDFEALLHSGADKVALNTAAVKNPAFITELANRFGRQAVVLSVEAQRVSPGRWEAYTDSGRERSGLDVLTWVKEATRLGAGEVLVTSIDQEGTRTGYDLELMKAVADSVNTPVIASGGMGTVGDFVALARYASIGGAAIADVLHFDRVSIEAIRSGAHAAGVNVRHYA